MVYTSFFLTRINHCYEAPSDAYLIYDINGGIYWIKPKDFSDFTIEWTNYTGNLPSFTIDLSSTLLHTVILDFDYSSQSGQNPRDTQIVSIIESVLKTTFLPDIPNFTFIIAMRLPHWGIHIHLPELQIAHDDYILLITHLQRKIQQALRNSDVYKLDILANAMLPGAAKPNATHYIPMRVVYVDEQNTYTINVPKDGQEQNFVQDIQELKKKFTKRKGNEKSLFRNLLNVKPNLILYELKQYMMPVIHSLKGHTLLYNTSISKTPNNSPDWIDLATFIYKKTKEQGYISKSNKLDFDNSNLLKIYNHIKLNSGNMIQFETQNHALKMWFERFGRLSVMNDSHIPPLFREVHETLQFEHMVLAENPNPIKTIMQFNDGYYFFPVFYALCQHYQINSLQLADEMYALLDTEFHSLLDKIKTISPKIILFATTEMSINTLHFCANNLVKERPTTHRDKLISIVNNNQRAILSVTTHSQIVELVRSMQERHLPIRVLKLKNALKKPGRFIWNSLTESWQELNVDREITEHVNNLWRYVKEFYNEYKDSGGLGGPDEDLINKFNTMSVVYAISSDTNMERKSIQMDAHKWFLRLQDGVLDLTTGHIGGVVPEFFLSDRKITLGMSRLQMTELCNHAPHLESIYETLTHKNFFLRYLQNLFLDTTDNLFSTLHNLLSEPTDDLVKSMLHFYINLCKCTCFEYDLLMYMLDVLASVFIGTNYERKFFVWKGLTRNGKSKLLELMGKVLGDYYHSIQSENLSPSHTANNATPELASTLFSCRMVTCEELEKRLDENRIKQITGNSFVTFRNMYEQNSGGIPTAKLFATTNNYPECKATEAFKDRVVAIPFEAEFVDNAPKKTSEQLEKNTFQKDVYVVEQSYRGCFLMLYYHLKKHINLKNGLVVYRNTPEYVTEFTTDYLIHADIYVQFKVFMDIQLMAGALTTMNDVKSAIRQYLKTTKNTSFHESDLFISFEKEFGHLSQTDIKMNTFNYTSIADEDELPQKKAKTDNYSSLVFYEGVIIKNLKRVNTDL